MDGRADIRPDYSPAAVHALYLLRHHRIANLPQSEPASNIESLPFPSVSATIGSAYLFVGLKFEFQRTSPYLRVNHRVQDNASGILRFGQCIRRPSKPAGILRENIQENAGINHDGHQGFPIERRFYLSSLSLGAKRPSPKPSVGIGASRTPCIGHWMLPSEKIKAARGPRMPLTTSPPCAESLLTSSRKIRARNSPSDRNESLPLSTHVSSNNYWESRCVCLSTYIERPCVSGKMLAMSSLARLGVRDNRCADSDDGHDHWVCLRAAKRHNAGAAAY